MFFKSLPFKTFCVVSALGCAVPPCWATDTASERAKHLVSALTLDQKIGLIRTAIGVWRRERPQPPGALGSAGYCPGVSSLGIPPLQETDAGLGVANPTNANYDATALPATLALGATFDPKLAVEVGRVIGQEARAMGFSVLLGGGANLIREPRGGRNFEYVSEDPLLTGVIAGAEVSGIQSQHVVATLKHFALNAQENGRVVLNAMIDEKPFREADLLAFEIAIEQGHPGAVMASYNGVNGKYASENAWLLTDVLKRDWAFDGWVMSDWGGTHSSDEAARAGLDQESGQEDDAKIFFDAPLRADVAAGRLSMGRLDDMVTRILRSQIALGVLDDPPHRGAPIDFATHAQVAKQVADQGIVLLKNDTGALPLDASLHRILIVGGHADVGVLSGGGSSQVVPLGSTRFEGWPAKTFWGKPLLFDPDAPLAALRRKAPGVTVDFAEGHDVSAAVDAAKEADAVVVFADRWANESLDLDSLTLPDSQDALITALAAANKRTIVVLETTGSIAMPWLDKVRGVVEAWYPGERGGQAIADVLLGAVNPSGRLPVSFPKSEAELPRPTIPDRASAASYPLDPISKSPFNIDYNVEGADVGYKWYLRSDRAPQFPFGFGLSYTRFSTSNLRSTLTDGGLTVEFDVRNDGDRAGIDTPQVYLAGGGFTRRLIGWQRVALEPHASRHVSLTVDPRLTASFDVAAHGWRVAPGSYTVSLQEDALRKGLTTQVALAARSWSARHGLGSVEAGLGPAQP